MKPCFKNNNKNQKAPQNVKDAFPPPLLPVLKTHQDTGPPVSHLVTKISDPSKDQVCAGFAEVLSAHIRTV